MSCNKKGFLFRKAFLVYGKLSPFFKQSIISFSIDLINGKSNLNVDLIEFSNSSGLFSNAAIKKAKGIKIISSNLQKNAIGSARHVHRINLIAKRGILKKKPIKYIKSFISFFGTFSG